MPLFGAVTVADGTVEGVDDAPVTHFSLEARRRIGASPVSVFARYDRGNLRNEGETPNDDLVDNSLSLGLSYRWGSSSSLQDYERSSASLQSPTMLMRYFGYSHDFD